jgi:hypothetical protein
VHEELAGVEVDDLVGRHPAVGTANPQVLRRLLAFDRLKKSGSEDVIRAAHSRFLSFRCFSRDASIALTFSLSHPAAAPSAIEPMRPK